MNFANGNIRKIRLSTGRNQQQFWSAVGITQSGGSRYESGRTPPKPVQMLLTIAYAPEKQAAKLATEMRAAG